MKNTNRYIYAVFAIMMLCVILLITSNSQPAGLRDKIEEGKPFRFVNDEEYRSQLTDFCVRDDRLYVLFGDVGVLKIYDQNGVYIDSYAFRKTKGASSLRTDGEYVWLIDPELNYYIFSSGELVDHVGYSDYGDYLAITDTFAPVEEQRKTDDTQYYLKLASICRKNADGSSVQVVHRPFWLAFFQGAIPFITIAFWMIVLVLLKILSGPKRNRRK